MASSPARPRWPKSALEADPPRWQRGVQTGTWTLTPTQGLSILSATAFLFSWKQLPAKLRVSGLALPLLAADRLFASCGESTFLVVLSGEHMPAGTAGVIGDRHWWHEEIRCHSVKCWYCFPKQLCEHHKLFCVHSFFNPLTFNFFKSTHFAICSPNLADQFVIRSSGRNVKEIHFCRKST